jgi:hypothetical protein
MSKKENGLTITPILIGLVVSLLVIAFFTRQAVVKNNEESKKSRLLATQMSDLGFQSITEQIMKIESIADSSFSSVDSTPVGDDWYRINVQKVQKDDTMTVTIESIGGSGDEVVAQKKNFKLLKIENDTGICWEAISR